MMMTALYALAVVLVVVLAPLTLAGKVLLWLATSILLLLIKKQNKLGKIVVVLSTMGNQFIAISPTLLLHLHHPQLNSSELLHHLPNLSCTSKLLSIRYRFCIVILTIRYYYSIISPTHLFIHLFFLLFDSDCTGTDSNQDLNTCEFIQSLRDRKK